MPLLAIAEPCLRQSQGLKAPDCLHRAALCRTAFDHNQFEVVEGLIQDGPYTFFQKLGIVKDGYHGTDQREFSSPDVIDEES